MNAGRVTRLWAPFCGEQRGFFFFFSFPWGGFFFFFFFFLEGSRILGAMTRGWVVTVSFFFSFPSSVRDWGDCPPSPSFFSFVLPIELCYFFFL